jgi:L,D-transpeptidase ErfK/SrfK
MVACIKLAILLILLAFHYPSIAKKLTYGAKLCEDTNHYSCYTVKPQDKWAGLFKDSKQMELVMRLNRMNIELKAGMKIAIPLNSNINLLDIAPFPKEITPPGNKTIFVSIDKLAWAAYTEQGSLLRWGPASTAQGYCPDIKRTCNTITGKFTIYRKGGQNCISSKYPVPKGGAPMPYCMFFHGGFAMHGSYEVPGYNASHGCIRLMIEDAKWLHQEFVSNDLDTTVIVTKE